MTTITNSQTQTNQSTRSIRNFINQFNDRPSLKILGIGSIVSIILLGITNTILEASYQASQFPVPFAEGQTSFDGNIIKSYYQHMIDLGTLNIYVRTQFIDFLFIGAVIATGFFVWMLVARLHQKGSFLRSAGLWLAFALPLAGLMDAVENLISFFMLAAPLTFPNWIAIVYSSSSVLKFGFWMIGLGWLLLSLTALILKIIWAMIIRIRG